MKWLTKEQQVKFYEEEIKKILSDYKAYLDSKCIDLVNKNIKLIKKQKNLKAVA